MRPSQRRLLVIAIEAVTREEISVGTRKAACCLLACKHIITKVQFLVKFVKIESYQYLLECNRIQGILVDNAKEFQEY